MSTSGLGVALWAKSLLSPHERVALLDSKSAIYFFPICLHVYYEYLGIYEIGHLPSSYRRVCLPGRGEPG